MASLLPEYEALSRNAGSTGRLQFVVSVLGNVFKMLATINLSMEIVIPSKMFSKRPAVRVSMSHSNLVFGTAYSKQRL